MLDDPDLPAAQMCESLEDLELVHRRGGADRALADSLRRSLAARGAAAKVRSLETRSREEPSALVEITFRET